MFPGVPNGSVRWGRARALVLISGWALGCGAPVGSATLAPNGQAATARDEDVAPPPPAPSTDPVVIATDRGNATLEIRGGALTFVADEPAAYERPVVCAETARAELAPYAGEEAVWRCVPEGLDDIPAAVVVTSGEAVIWTYTEFPFTDCYPVETLATVVDAVPDAARELRIQVLECDWTGAMSDDDRLFKWGEGAMRTIAEARIDCDYMGDTSDADAPEPPEDQTWLCGGATLELGGTRAAPTVTRIEVARGVYAHAQRDDSLGLRFGPQREGEQGIEPLRPEDVVPQVLRWDPEAFRFASAR